jgi:hypothetical protein
MRLSLNGAWYDWMRVASIRHGTSANAASDSDIVDCAESIRYNPSYVSYVDPENEIGTVGSSTLSFNPRIWSRRTIASATDVARVTPAIWSLSPSNWMLVGDSNVGAVKPTRPIVIVISCNPGQCR